MKTQPQCILCNSTRKRILFAGRDRRYDVPGIYTIVECPACGLVFLSPQPSDRVLAHHYTSDYYTHTPQRKSLKGILTDGAREMAFWMMSGTGLGGDQSAIKRMLASICRKSSFLNHLADVDSLPYLQKNFEALEVGFGSGTFLDFLASKGIRCMGVETDELTVEYALGRGHNVVEGELEKLKLNANTFDFIRMRHVLEHTRNPRDLIREAHRIQKPGGYIHIEVPNFSGLFAQSFRDRWVQLESPRHLFHFRPTTLQKLVKSCNYEIVSLKFDTQPWHLLGSLQYGLNELRAGGGKLDNRTRDLWEDGRLTSSLHKLAKRINATGFGENIILLARKPASSA